MPFQFLFFINKNWISKILACFKISKAGNHETSTLSDEMRSMVKNSGNCKHCDLACAGATLSHEMRIDCQKLRKKSDFTCAGYTLSHEMRVDRQKLLKNCDFTCARATRSHEMRVNRRKVNEKLRFYLSRSNPFERKKSGSMRTICGKIPLLLFGGATLLHKNEGRCAKTAENCDFTCPRATFSHEVRDDRQKLRKHCDFTCIGLAYVLQRLCVKSVCVKKCVCVKASVCKSVCV